MVSEAAQAEHAPPAPPLDLRSFSEYQLRMTLEFVQMADRKARFLMRIGLGLFGATFLGLPPSISVLKDYFQEGGGSLLAFGAVIFMYGLCITCLVVAMVKIISVVRPRIINNDQVPPSPLFFQSIAHMSIDQYKDMVYQLDTNELAEQMTTMIYHNSVVADAKFRKLDQAIRWMLGGGLFGFVFALLVIVSVQLL